MSTRIMVPNAPESCDDAVVGESTAAAGASRGGPSRQNEADLEFEHWLKVLRRRAPLFLAVLLGAIAIGMLAAWLRPARYEASATVTFGQSGSGILSSSSFTAPVPSTELQLARSSKVVSAADAPDVDVEVSTPDETSAILAFTASGRDPGRVAYAANRYARTYVAARRAQVQRQYQQSIDNLSEAVAAVGRRLDSPKMSSPDAAAERRALEEQREDYLAAIRQMRVAAVMGGAFVPAVTSAAKVPTEATGAGPLAAFGYVLVAALFLAGGAIAVADFRDRSVSGPKEAQALTAGPVIGILGGPAKRRGPALEANEMDVGAEPTSVMLADPHSPQAESVRYLRAALVTLESRGSLTVLLTSCMGDDGTASASLDLAISLARGVGRTVFLRLELPDGRSAQPRELSAAKVLAGPDISEHVSSFEGVEGLGLLAICVDDPDAMTGPAVTCALHQLRADYPYVVILAPALLRSSVALNIAGLVDGVVLCVRPGNTQERDLQLSSEKLTLVQARLLGTVLT